MPKSVKKIKLLQELEEMRRKLKRAISSTSSSSSDHPDDVEFLDVKEDRDPLKLEESDLGLSEEDEQVLTEPTFPSVEEPPEEVISSLLGAKPLDSEVEGEDLHTEIAIRWFSYLQKGVRKEERDKILEKYPLPKNCKALAPPEVNSVVLGCTSELTNKNDRFLKSLQHQLGHGLTALGRVMEVLIKENTSPVKVQTLADAGQLICNVHNAISVFRQKKISPHLNLEAQKVANNAPIDEFLFGKNFDEALKANQSLKKAKEDIKKKTPFRTSSFSTASTSFPRPIISAARTRSNSVPARRGSLNFQRGASRGRMRDQTHQRTPSATPHTQGSPGFRRRRQ